MVENVEIKGGPLDGEPVPKHWQVEAICVLLRNSGRYAIYLRQPDGDYRYDKTVAESELETSD